MRHMIQLGRMLIISILLGGLLVSASAYGGGSVALAQEPGTTTPVVTEAPTLTDIPTATLAPTATITPTATFAPSPTPDPTSIPDPCSDSNPRPILKDVSITDGSGNPVPGNVFTLKQDVHLTGIFDVVYYGAMSLGELATIPIYYQVTDANGDSLYSSGLRTIQVTESYSGPFTLHLAPFNDSNDGQYEVRLSTDRQLAANKTFVEAPCAARATFSIPLPPTATPRPPAQEPQPAEEPRTRIVAIRMVPQNDKAWGLMVVEHARTGQTVTLSLMSRPRDAPDADFKPTGQQVVIALAESQTNYNFFFDLPADSASIGSLRAIEDVYRVEVTDTDGDIEGASTQSETFSFGEPTPVPIPSEIPPPPDPIVPTTTPTATPPIKNNPILSDTPTPTARPAAAGGTQPGDENRSSPAATTLPDTGATTSLTIAALFVVALLFVAAGQALGLGLRRRRE